MQSAIAFSLLLFAGSLQASLITSASASGDFSLDGSGSRFGCSQSGAGSSGCSVSAHAGASHAADGLYSATAQYGQLDIDAYTSTYGGELNGGASASFADTLTITGGTGQGTLVLAIDAWGFGSGELCDGGRIAACLPTISFSLGALSIYPRVPVQQVTYTFTFGAPFAISAQAYAYANTWGNETQHKTAHFQIDSITVRGSDGNAMGGYAVSSASAAAYPGAGLIGGQAGTVSNPEPATGGVLLAACAAIWRFRRRAL